MVLVTVTKCHGTGNDFVLLDAREPKGVDYPAIARQLCHRRFSVGADGLLVIERSLLSGCAARMRIFNADGSEAEMCGNGIRCVTMFLHETELKSAFDIETVAGVIPTEVVGGAGCLSIRVRMGIPAVNVAAQVYSRDAYEVSIGNPHVVLFASGDLQEIDLENVANSINKSKDAAVNVELAAIGADGIAMRVHERGVGETWACGTGACAVAVAAITSGRVSSPVLVRSKGGAVKVEWAGAGQPAFLTGDAHLVYRAQVEIPTRSTPMSTV